MAIDSDKILSIIIPMYNMENYIAQCLESLLIQDIDLLDIIVVNDGSKDKSSEIAHKYHDKFPSSIRVIDKKNGNYGSCINAGLLIAKGKYIKILDADDSFDSNGLNLLLRSMESVDVDMFLSDYIRISENGQEMGRCTFPIKSNRILEIKDWFDQLSKIQMHGVAYRTHLIKSINYTQTEGISYSDQEWIFYPLSKTSTVFYVNTVVYKYLIGRNGQTMEESIFHKKVGDRILILKRRILWYRDQLDKQDKIISMSILKVKIIEQIRSVYRSLLVYNRDNKVAKEVDSFILTNLPEFYTLSDELSYDTNWRYKFIKDWRKRGKIIPHRVIMIYEALIKNCSKLKKKLRV